MKVHLVDGTFELFRHHFGRPSHATAEGREVAATRGVLSSLLGMLASGVTHVGVATDHVVESFRNELWPGYKTSAGMPPELLQQFPLLEEAVAALGITVWPMVELEADDALASAAVVAAEDPAVEQVLICTPDKDLAQSVRGTRVVQLDRRRPPASKRGADRRGDEESGAGTIVDEAGVVARFGVPPPSIPDWLALVGDSADGFPGLPGWGPRSASAVLARYGHIDAVPEQPWRWDVDVRGATSLSATLAAQRELALLFRVLATLRVDRSLLGSVDQLRWRGPTPELAGLCRRIDAAPLAERAARLAAEG
jgi:5'-3' exonuclease